MIENVEELPAELGIDWLILHLEGRGLLHQGRIEVEEPWSDHAVPAQIAVRECWIGLKSCSVQPLGHSLTARDGVRIAHQIGSIGLTRVRGVAVYGNVKRVTRGPGQDAAETPATQNRVQDGVETRTESPPPSIGELPDLAQHERVR